MAKGKDKNTAVDEEMEEAKTEVAAKAKREQQNGVTKPVGEGPVARVWSLCDAFVAQTGEKPDKNQIVDAAYKDGISPATALTQVGRYMKYHGMSAPRVATTEGEKLRKRIEQVTIQIEKMAAKLSEKQNELGELNIKLNQLPQE